MTGLAFGTDSVTSQKKNPESNSQTENKELTKKKERDYNNKGGCHTDRCCQLCHKGVSSAKAV